MAMDLALKGSMPLEPEAKMVLDLTKKAATSIRTRPRDFVLTDMQIVRTRGRREVRSIGRLDQTLA